MMTRFVRLLGIVAVVMILLCTFTIGLFRTQPVALAIEGLGDCEGLPCVLNIRPERTTWPDAQAIFTHNASAQLQPEEITVNLNNGEVVSLTASDDHSRVDLVSLDFTGAQPTLGLLMAYYGLPCMVTVNPYVRYIAVRFPYVTAYINHLESAPAKVSADSRIDSLDLYSTRDSCRVQDHTRETYWHGFEQIPYSPVRFAQR